MKTDTGSPYNTKHSVSKHLSDALDSIVYLYDAR